MSPNTVAEVLAALTVAGTIAQAIEDNAAPGTVVWRIGKALSAVLPELKGLFGAFGAVKS